jgi:hypothetical protein
LGGGGIRSAVHLRYLGHVADEKVECDVPSIVRDGTSIRTPQPRTTDSGVQLPQRRHLRDVGGKHPSEAILPKQPAGLPLVPSGGGRNRPSMGNVQICDGRHRGKKGWEPARQRIPCDVPAAPPVQRHLREPGPCCAHLAALAAGPVSLRGRVLLRGTRFRSGPWRGSSLGTACGSYYESTRAHIDESRRSRMMASGNWPVKFCPLRSLQASAF